MSERMTVTLLLAGPLLGACATPSGDSGHDVVVDDAGAEEEAADVPTGALTPVAAPVDVYLTSERRLSPVLLTTLSGSVAVVWGERDAGGGWLAPGFAVVDGDGTVTAAAVHLAESGHEPIGLETHAALGQLAYFTLQRGAGCAATLHRWMLDAAGRTTGPIATVDTLDDPLAVHVASLSGNAVVLVAEGGACTPRDYPLARVIVVGADGRAAGDVPLGEAWRVSGLAAIPGGAGYLVLRDTHEDGVMMSVIGPGGGLDRSWTIVRRDGTCACPSSRGVAATSGEDYLAAWSGAVDGVQSWYLHRGPYDDDLEWGADPAVTALAARFDARAAIAPFEGDYVVAYLPGGGAALRVDLLGEDGALEEGWAPAEVPGEVASLAVAAVGHRVAVAWIEVWAGATAPHVLKVGLFERLVP